MLRWFARHPFATARGFLLNRIWAHQSNVRYGDVELAFVGPNTLCQYRIRTFASKEPETLRWIDHMRDDEVLWDVGANIGLYSIYAAKRGLRNVVAIEPSVFNLQALALNIRRNRVSGRILVVPLAAGDKAGAEQLNMSTTEVGGALSSFGVAVDQHGRSFQPVFQYQVLGVPLDHLLSLGVDNPHHLKIDVDGIEHLVLQGAHQVLRRVKTCLVEVVEDRQEQAKLISNLLSEAGLSLKERHDLGLPGTCNQLWSR